MNLNFKKLKELQQDIGGSDYYNNWSSIKKGLYVFSWLCNGAIVFFGTYFLYDILKTAFPDGNHFLMVAISIIFFVLYEIFLKRTFTDLWAKEVNKKKGFKNSREKLVLSILAFIVYGGSFFVSLSGSNELFNRKESLELNYKDKKEMRIDSIRDFYNEKIAKTEKEIKQKESDPVLSTYKELIKKKGNVNNVWRKNKYQEEINQIKPDVKSIRSDIDEKEKRIENLRNKKEKEIKEITRYFKQKYRKHTTETNEIKIGFIFLAAFFEIMIFLGIWYRRYFWKRVRKEWNFKIDNDPRFGRWYKWKMLLDIIYQVKFQTAKPGTDVPTAKDLVMKADMEGISINQYEISNQFFKLMNSLGVIKTRGPKRYLNITYEQASQLLDKQFNIIQNHE